MRVSIAIAACLLAACTWHRRPKNTAPLRPLETGAFQGYVISDCPKGGHLVKLDHEPDERGEVNSRERIDNYRHRYLEPALGDAVEVVGWGYESTCARGGLELRTHPDEQGEALHRIGETIAANPTDIEVAVVPRP